LLQISDHQARRSCFLPRGFFIHPRFFNLFLSALSVRETTLILMAPFHLCLSSPSCSSCLIFGILCTSIRSSAFIDMIPFISPLPSSNLKGQRGIGGFLSSFPPKSLNPLLSRPLFQSSSYHGSRLSSSLLVVVSLSSRVYFHFFILALLLFAQADFLMTSFISFPFNSWTHRLFSSPFSFMLLIRYLPFQCTGDSMRFPCRPPAKRRIFFRKPFPRYLFFPLRDV